nr:DUF523 domain-containing protein [Desulfobacterales bacterium]
MVAVSACLLGYNCRYDASNSACETLIERIRSESVLAICPEQLGGLPTPRSPARIFGGDGFDVLEGKASVIDSEGIEVTEAFVKGAFAALDQIRRYNVKRCFLKSKSPSCGLGKEEGSIGVLAALLTREGFEVEEIKS